MHAVVFAVLAALILASAIWVVALRNLFRAALSLGLVLLGVAGLFILLEAEFLAFVQVLVYVGAILTLVVFAIMLTAKLQTAPVTPPSRPVLPAAVVSSALFVLLLRATPAFVPPSSAASAPVPLARLGQELVGPLVLPFEVISLVFVAAIVGAVVLASARQPKRPASG